MNRTKFKEVYRVYVDNILYDIYYNNIVAMNNVTKLKSKFKNVIMDSSNNKPMTKAEKEILNKRLI
jgi:hypothetical protein